MAASPPPTNPMMSSRKRKADDDFDERMSASPSSSPNIHPQQLPSQRPIKKARAGLAGRPLTLPRLLETLDADSLRNVLKSICDAHPSISQEVPKLAPRPSVSSALDVLRKYESTLQHSFPFGGDQSSDYAYNRVRQHLFSLLEALNDFTPHFLPPNETQVASCLAFLDAATNIIHRLPNWHSFQNNIAKHNAYEEMSRAWIAVIHEAAKRAGGIALRYEAWDRKLAKHNQEAHGRLQPAVNEMAAILGWAAGGSQSSSSLSTQSRVADDTNSIRQELLSGTYGSNVPVRVGPW